MTNQDQRVSAVHARLGVELPAAYLQQIAAGSQRLEHPLRSGVWWSFPSLDGLTAGDPPFAFRLRALSPALADSIAIAERDDETLFLDPRQGLAVFAHDVGRPKVRRVADSIDGWLAGAGRPFDTTAATPESTHLVGAWEPSSSPTLSDAAVKALPSFRFDVDGPLLEWHPVFRNFVAGTHSLSRDRDGLLLACETGERRAVYRVLSRRDDILALQGPGTSRHLVYYRRLDDAATTERFGRYRPRSKPRNR